MHHLKEVTLHGVNISDKCRAIVEEFEIQEKIAFVITDNAANMVKAFRDSCALFDDPTSTSMEEL